MRHTLLATLLAVTCLTAWAGLDATGTMRYAYQVGATSTGELVVQIDGLELGGGLPMAATGSLRVKITVQVLAVDEQGVARMKMSFGPLRVEFLGEPQTVGDLEPIEFAVDSLGRPVGLEEVEGGQKALLAAGGIPVQLLAVLAGVVPMPEDPVGMDEEWTVETEADVPGVGHVTITTASRLTGVTDQAAVVNSVVQALLPEITTPNPMGGGDVLIREGQLAIEDFSRSINLDSGLVTSASGQMTVNCRANLGGMGEMPLKIMGSFSVEPAEQNQATRPPVSAPRSAGGTMACGRWGQLALQQIRLLLARLPQCWVAQR